MGLKRLKDWPERLNTLIELNRFKEFKWGEHDCLLFAAKAIKATTGIDYTQEYIYSYSDKEEADQEILRLGAKDLKDFITNVLGKPLSNPHLASRGDIVVVRLDYGIAAGVCIGARAATPSAKGLVFIHLAKWEMAWRV